MNPVASYVPGRSVLHRAPAGAKLAGLLAGITLLVAAGGPAAGAATAAAALAAYPLCGLGLRRPLGILRAVLPFIALLALFQALAGDAAAALRMAALLSSAVLLAGLVTATTRVAAMLTLFERLCRPLAPLGADPRRVALVLALTVRAVPLVADVARSCREAYAARGIRRRPHLLVVPIVVGLIRSAESMGEAMTARGLD
ncbi:CbiQ family ECF transporter T component [Nocardiopsis coralliicola]